jgi:hypothetical protein
MVKPNFHVCEHLWGLKKGEEATFLILHFFEVDSAKCGTPYSTWKNGQKEKLCLWLSYQSQHILDKMIMRRFQAWTSSQCATGFSVAVSAMQDISIKKSVIKCMYMTEEKNKIKFHTG